MILTDKQQEQKKWLESLGLKEYYPFIENCVESSTDNIEDVYFRAVYSFETFTPIEETNQYYSANELRNIKLIQRYQKSMGAYHSNIKKERTITEEEIGLIHPHEYKSKLAKADKVNKGIYFITGLRGYTSTTIFNNPSTEAGKGNRTFVGCGMFKKNRVVGRIEEVLPETLKLYDFSFADFHYPYMINGREESSDNIYDVYEKAYKFGKFFEVLDSRMMYSSQQKRIIRKLQRVGEKNG